MHYALYNSGRRSVRRDQILHGSCILHRNPFLCVGNLVPHPLFDQCIRTAWVWILNGFWTNKCSLQIQKYHIQKVELIAGHLVELIAGHLDPNYSTQNKMQYLMEYWDRKCWECSSTQNWMGTRSDDEVRRRIGRRAQTEVRRCHVSQLVRRFLEGGHYLAYFIDNKWYFYNDNKKLI